MESVEANSWNRLAATHSPSDLYMDYDHVDVGGDEPRSELPCPFCSQDFDIVGLCCHIYEYHAAEAKNGVCPICYSRVEMDLVGHITMEHGDFLKVQNRRGLHKDYSGSNSRTSFRIKEHERIQSLDGVSSYPLTHEQTDPLLWAFVSTFLPAEPSKDARLPSLHDESANSKLNEKLNDESANSERLVNGRQGKNTARGKSEDREEQSRRSQFLRELLLSTILQDSR